MIKTRVLATTGGFKNMRMKGMMAAGLVLILTAFLPAASFGETSAPGGAITGRVTADKGAVYAVGIKAEDTVHRIICMIFTLEAHYQIFNLPPESYRVYAQVTPQEPTADLRGRPYPPKIGIDGQSTIWFAGLRMDTLNSFRPNGNVPATLSARK